MSCARKSQVANSSTGCWAKEHQSICDSRNSRREHVPVIARIKEETLPEDNFRLGIRKESI
jgi:hypothetical protein